MGGSGAGAVQRTVVFDVCVTQPLLMLLDVHFTDCCSNW